VTSERLYVQTVPVPPGSVAYWDQRWVLGPPCPGSRGDEAAAKAAWLSTLVRGSGARSLVDLGCGDGTVGALVDVESYVGVDVSHVALAQAMARRPDRSYLLVPPGTGAAQVTVVADIAASMDVVFHLLDDAEYRTWMARLFGSARRLVAVYGTDYDSFPEGHMRHRHLTRDVAAASFTRDWTLVHGLDKGSEDRPGWMLWEQRR
jgi:SAM-dependent methyltransferase